MNNLDNKRFRKICQRLYFLRTFPSLSDTQEIRRKNSMKHKLNEMRAFVEKHPEFMARSTKFLEAAK